MKKIISFCLCVTFLFLTIPMLINPELYLNDALLYIRGFAIIMIFWVIGNQITNYLDDKKDKLIEEKIQILKTKIAFLEKSKR